LLTLYIILEVFSRLCIDPLYFSSIDTYRIKENKSEQSLIDQIIGKYKKTLAERIDYLFIGSSRVAAAIDAREIETLEINSNVINAGRGYSTGGINYMALKSLLRRNKNIFKGSKVCIELPGGTAYERNFNTYAYHVDERMPHLILPYINLPDLVKFLKYSNNSLSIKIQVIGFYSSSFYRTVPFIKENRKKISSKITDVLADNHENGGNISSSGGIKSDSRAILEARKLAIQWAEENIDEQKGQQPVTFNDLDNSMLNAINELIKSNGGELILYDMPISSTQQRIYETKLSQENKDIFDQWAQINGIRIIHLPDFEYHDNDFPDLWHLSSERKKEFTIDLYNAIKE